ncbi:type II toxin-antitoxin system RelE/ParE family toxin [Pseudomonas sp. G(2018)]|uniref:type II toxin-antitoxin system RelE/ParE family toxin n=1 Tax=Pseudomonas sp. G(2018) TaxID=2502242 RepID=UPI0010FA4C33|nr:type II toxin-antitoxin system RelE/ParE family toxin [Pseudomonas sp. G(2018)]
MRLVKWKLQALDALTEIIDYIEQYSPAAAASLHRTIVTATEGLSFMPYSFKSGRLPDTREMFVHPNYVVVYQVKEHVEILTVLHARQEYTQHPTSMTVR